MWIRDESRLIYCVHFYYRRNEQYQNFALYGRTLENRNVCIFSSKDLEAVQDKMKSIQDAASRGERLVILS